MGKAYICDICKDFVEGEPQHLEVCKNCYKATKAVKPAPGQDEGQPVAAGVPSGDGQDQAATKGRGRPPKARVIYQAPLPEPQEPKPGILVRVWRGLIGA